MDFAYLLIHTDTPEWDDEEFLFFPSWVLGSENQLIPVFCGKPSPEYFNDGKGSYGIYVRSDHHDKIDFEKSLVFFHEIDITEITSKVISDVVDMCKDQCGVEDHVHINKAAQCDLVYDDAEDESEEPGGLFDEEDEDDDWWKKPREDAEE